MSVVYFFIFYFFDCVWVFVAARGLSLVAARGLFVVVHRLLITVASLVVARGPWGVQALVVVAHGL